ncbi:MAG: hypothetical protein WD801_04620 [Gemmatimonadaceae bacterium]
MNRASRVRDDDRSVATTRDGAMAETSPGDSQEARRAPRTPGGRPARRHGLSARGERRLDAAGLVLFVVFASAWAWSIHYANTAERRGEPIARPSSMLSAALTGRDVRATAYLTDAALEAFASTARGASGKLQVQTVLPGDTLRADSVPGDARVVYRSHGAAATEPEARPAVPGIRAVAVAIGNAIKPVSNLNLITLHPFSAKRQGRIGQYLIGSWPGERGASGPSQAPPERYANPRGFIQVMRENQDTRVSEHFRLRDFLTKGQPDVWPKYLVLEMRLVDKLELVLSDLAARGIAVDAPVVMSGFRTPSYNVGGGNTEGRADLSRHMYGDAADLFLDSDRNGTLDDLNGDGRVDTRDVRVILDAVDRVERSHPTLVGGAGVYGACCGHGPFIHIDTRGYRARW